jgi:hypothetical protein
MIRSIRWFNRNKLLRTHAVLLAGVLAGGVLVLPLQAQSGAAAPAKAAQSSSASHYKPNRVVKRAVEYYGLVWGVDSLSVKAVESGELIRFSYRVLDPEKAKTLNDKKIEAVLVSPGASVKLVIPSMEKVGQLRQSNTPDAGRSYWMAFSNPRRTVKRGDRVNVDIGSFHASGLEVK